ncbi:leucyl/phenylalanyl-tRNA--protein transferase [Spiribacter salilacus]|uniref:leucyl/phenylalanyl-tRNA--protein transferase n=1 Tax=Spiribacter salilacus TaxID=2664894 RepID=UPI00350E4C9D
MTSHPILPVPWLAADDETTPLPHPATALTDPNGLLAIGATLSPRRLEAAYRAGIFPWFSEHEPILWWSPDPRAVLVPTQFKASRRFRQTLRKHDYSITLDTAFSAVMHACAAPRTGQPGTWITEEMQAAYDQLHTLGLAHSIEVWKNRQLIGGLYGVSLGGAFFGESMFSRQPNASKIAMAWLCGQLAAWDFAFLDCQMPTPHLLSLGAKCLPRAQFLDWLAKSQRQPDHIGRWQLSITASGYE